MTYPITYPAANSFSRRNMNSTVLAISNASSIEDAYTASARIKMKPALTRAGIFLLPSIGFIRINPDILIRIRENRVNCAILSIDMSSLPTSSLYQLEYLHCKVLQRFQHTIAGEYEDHADHQQFRHKRDRLFMDLRSGLYDRDQDTNQHTDHEKRACQLDYHDKYFIHQISNFSVCHLYASFTVT